MSRFKSARKTWAARLDRVEAGRWARIREKIALRWWIVRIVLLAVLAVLLFVVKVPRVAMWVYLLGVAILTAVFQTEANRKRKRQEREQAEREYSGPLR